MKVLALFLLLSPSLVLCQEKPDMPTPKVAQSPATVEHVRLQNTLNQQLSLKPHAANREFWITVAAMEGSAVYATVEARGCRNRLGPAPCEEHYGSLVGFEIARHVATVAFVALYYMCRDDFDNSRWCNALSYPVIVLNTGWAIRQETAHAVRKD
jgi:hypothetical protein